MKIQSDDPVGFSSVSYFFQTFARRESELSPKPTTRQDAMNTAQRLILALAAGSLLAVSSAHAATRTWGGGNLDWTNTTASGWGGSVPTTSATINSGIVTVTTAITPGNTPGAVNVNGGMLVISAGKLVSGSWSNGKTFTIGSGATLRLNSWGYDVAGSLGALDYGSGRLVVNGGIIEVVGNSTNSGRIFTVGTGGATLRSSMSAGQTWTLNIDSNPLYHDIRVNDGRTLTLDGTGHGRIENTLLNSSGSGNITKAGTGRWTLAAANTYTGITTLTDGILSVGTIGDGGVAGNLGQATNAAGNIVFNGGTLQYTGPNATSDRAFTINAGKTATIDTTNNIAFAGATGPATTGALVKTGAGTLTLTGTSTYTGPTTVKNGTLLINGTNNTSAGLITVEASATLGGSGTMGDVTILNGGFLAPGTSPGTITVGKLTLNGTSVLAFDLGAPTMVPAPGSSDYIAVGGNLTLAGTLRVDHGIYEPKMGDQWLLMTYTGVLDGDIATITPTAPNSLSYDILFEDKNVFLTVVPEPASAGLLLIGGLALRVLSRRRTPRK